MNRMMLLGSVGYNLGMVYASQGDFEDAITNFQSALDDSRYATPYKAYQAMGNALLKLGKSAEAGAAFRSAALDEMNPDPNKGPLNLGVALWRLIVLWTPSLHMKVLCSSI